MTGFKPVSRPHNFPNKPSNVKTKGQWLNWLAGIARNKKYPVEVRKYAAWLFKKEYKGDLLDKTQTSISANEQNGEMQQVQTIADGATGGGFSDLVKCEKIFLTQSKITPKDTIIALGYFLMGSGKSILALGLGTAEIGKVLRVAGKGCYYLFKVVGQKGGKLVLQFLKKNNNPIKNKIKI